MPDASRPRSIIVFDGVCVLCSRWLAFLLARDHDRRFHFAAMQSDAGRQLLVQAGLDPDDPSSFILVEGEHIYCQTNAITAVLKTLNRPWPAVATFIRLFPRALRDWLYRRVARNRYSVFGKRETCYVPAPEEKARFLT